MWACWNLLRLEIADDYDPQSSDDVHRSNAQGELALDAWISENRPDVSTSWTVQQESNSSITRQNDKAPFRLKELYLGNGNFDFNLNTTLPFVSRCRGPKRFRMPRVTSEAVLTELARSIPTYWQDLEDLDLRNFEVQKRSIDLPMARVLAACARSPKSQSVGSTSLFWPLSHVRMFQIMVTTLTKLGLERQIRRLEQLRHLGLCLKDPMEEPDIEASDEPKAMEVAKLELWNMKQFVDPAAIQASEDSWRKL
ncbi:hypothetical protein BGZ74_009720 [Mortierella antarctica]|nr:hypothetical protein BGZ74_009720 [Mortierella antarctica]